MNKKVSLLILTIISLSATAQINWPVITQTNKPWTRWWWEGSAVDKKNLTINLEQYSKAGLGGVEITPIYGIYGYEKQFIEFLSPKWMEMFVHTLNEAKRLNIGVDLANGTGWPFGGPWVTDADASKTVYYKTYSIKGGSTLNEAIEYKQEALVRTANNRPAGIDSILQPVSKNKNLQALALDQIQYPGKLPLKMLMAYSDAKKRLDIIKNVDAAGKLTWTAPPGNWTIYALFEGLHGKMVERAAPGGEGYAIDHFSARSADHYFKKFDDAFKGYDISYLRSFFNDSYEVDDARGQGNWTPELFTEFKKRKGYDLADNLQALFGKDDAETNSRVIYDYRSVIDELLLENFTMKWKKWGETRGKMLRNQSHGSPANTLDLYSVVDIPETEGTDILRFKFATSAANVTGKKLVSSESATWLNEHFLSSLGDVKKAIDLYFLGGVNHIFYHGTAYSPANVPWPGWLFYAAVHFQPTNPQWKDFHTLNEYIARVQSFLQNSKPDNDVLLYYPIVDRYSEPGRDLLQHFDGMEKNFEKTEFEHVSKWMMDNGYSFDFFSDRQLQNFSVRNNSIITGGNAYQTILLPANKCIPIESLRKLFALVKAGAKVAFYKSAPTDVPGLDKLEQARKEFSSMTEQLNFKNDEPITIGAGRFYAGKDLEKLLQAAGARKEKLTASGLQFLRRRTTDGSTYFISNRSDKPFSDWVPLHSEGSFPVLFDAMTGRSGLGKKQDSSSENTSGVYLELQPYESIIVQFYKKSKTGQLFPYYKKLGSSEEIKGEWSLQFLDGGPTLPAKMNNIKLGSWTELGGDEVKNFSGTAKYSVSFQQPTTRALAYTLDLGKVNETAEVFLNGKKVSTLIGPTFTVTIAASAFKQNNQLEVVVANLMANRITYMDKNNLPWKIFYNTNMPARRRENSKDGIFTAADWKPLPSGLLGPVTLTPLTQK